MCGILGVLHFDGSPVDRATLRAMAQVTVHRGPDDEGFYTAVKIRGGRLKHAMKQAVSDLLPPDILERQKRGFGTPMGAWLKGDLASLMHELLSDAAIGERALLDPAAVRGLIAQHEASRIDGTDRLLALMNLEIWARMYLDARSPQDVGAELEEALA